MAEKVLQRVVTPPRCGLSQLYFRFDGQSSLPLKRGRRTLVLLRGTVLRMDTWFNAFFESYWREYTHLSELTLRLCVSGTGMVRLYRRCSGQRPGLLQEIAFTGRDRELSLEVV